MATQKIETGLIADDAVTSAKIGTLDANLEFGDSVKAIFGAGSDLQIYHDGSNSYIDDAGTGVLVIRSNEIQLQKYTGETMASFIADGTVQLRYDNVAKLSTTSTGIDVTGTATMDLLTTDDDVSGLTTLGRYSSGFAFSLIRPSSTATGLEIRTNAGNALAHFLNDGTTKLHHNGSPKLATTSTGIDVTGTAVTDGLTVAGNAYVGAGNYFTDSTSGYFFGGNGSFTNGVYGVGTNNMAFNVNGSERMRIESAGTVKISHADTASEGLRVIQTTAARTSGGALALIYDDQSGTTQPTLKVIQNGTGDILQLFDGGSQVVTVKDGGNLLVGKTGLDASVAGTEIRPNLTAITSAGDTPLYLRRNTNDGEIINFKKDTSAIGSIGSYSGVPYIGYAGGAGGGIMFNGKRIEPTALGSSRTDGENDIGSINYRWKDLYLSGGAYIGGTGAANKLDDYEEGTWTPAFGYSGGNGNGSWTYSIIEGNYTKIGRVVYFRCEVRFSTFIKGTASGAPQISGLPFASGGITNGEHYGVNFHSYNTPLPTTAGTFPAPQVAFGSTVIYLFTIANNAAYGSTPDPDSNSQFKIAGWYITG